MSLSHGDAGGVAHVAGVDPFRGSFSSGVFPFYEPVILYTFIVVALGGVALLGAVLIMISLFVGEFLTAGWLTYAPFSDLEYSPSVGMDY